MSEDVIGKLFDEIRKLGDRLARVETTLKMQLGECRKRDNWMDSVDERLDALERANSTWDGLGKAVAWSITTGIAVYAAVVVAK